MRSDNNPVSQSKLFTASGAPVDLDRILERETGEKKQAKQKQQQSGSRREEKEWSEKERKRETIVKCFISRFLRGSKRGCADSAEGPSIRRFASASLSLYIEYLYLSH